MNAIDHGKLWPGVVSRVGDFDCIFEAHYKMTTKMCKSYQEAEEWILAQKEKDHDPSK